MSRIYVPYIAALSLLWGASYMFIKVAVREYEPAAMIMFRLILASVLLAGVFFAQRGVKRALADIRGLGWQGFGVGVVNGAIPFTLIAWGEKHIDSGVAAIANATVPIFVVLLALRWQPSEAVRGARLGGILLGLVGVGVLAGVHPSGGWWGAAGTFAVVVASLSYAVGGLWGQRLVSDANGFALATAAMLGATLAIIPFGLTQLPSHVPGWKETGSVVALAVLGTAIAQILLFRVLRSDGAARMSLVTYLLPVTALFYGAVFLGESVSVEELIGMALILGGVALGSGALRLPRREPAPATPAP
jgi:drug/metabolite transporter (DMT)-like permease